MLNHLLVPISFVALHSLPRHLHVTHSDQAAGKNAMRVVWMPICTAHRPCYTNVIVSVAEFLQLAITLPPPGQSDHGIVAQEKRPLSSIWQEPDPYYAQSGCHGLRRLWRNWI